MRLSVLVLHNQGPGRFWEYDAKNAELHHAHTFQIEADNTSKAADLIWILTNVDSVDHLRSSHPHLAKYAEQVESYRSRENRSLSVGDALVILEGERVADVLAVAMSGWQIIDYPKFDLTDVANQGRVSLAREAIL